jgi:phytanoyl-CoA hydroxylase
MDGAGLTRLSSVNWLRQRYDHQGIVVVRQVVDRVFIGQLRSHLTTLDPPPNGLIPIRLETNPVAQTIAAHEALLGLASELLGGPAELFGATFVVKQAQSPWQVSWHQDGEPWRRQWGLHHAVTLWVALDASGPHNGGLRMIPGSHCEPARALEPVQQPYDVFGWASPRELVDESAAVDVTVEPGDVSAHHPAMVHASGANRSAGPRRALSLRYRAAPNQHDTACQHQQHGDGEHR